MVIPARSTASAQAKAIRQHVLEMCHGAKAAHVASSLSCVDMLSVLYFTPILRVRPKEPHWEGRDYFILSKGHAAAAYYATLAEAGFFQKSELSTFYGDDTRLAGHPVTELPGVDLSTGSLGHGLGVGSGLALSFMRSGKGNRIFVMLSDGELDEGSNWEAVLFAGDKKLANLIAFVDYNKIQSFGTVEEVLPLEPMEDKFCSFGWAVKRIDGHSIPALEKLLASDSEFMKEKKPKMIIADTVKGKGVSFMENKLEWHYRPPSDDDLKKAQKEVDAHGL